MWNPGMGREKEGSKVFGKITGLALWEDGD